MYKVNYNEIGIKIRFFSKIPSYKNLQYPSFTIVFDNLLLKSVLSNLLQDII